MKKNIQVSAEERPFGIEELFFSTTDAKGIITSCNNVFLRVAQYEPEEILGKAHNIVRHPDMPRCVFKLLWDYLLSGRPIGAYVKNRAKEGGYYWVFALAFPIDGGFLSIRLKPSSPIFNIVQELYPQLLDCENASSTEWRSGMEASGKLLMQKLRELGFSSYDQFMSTALRVELAARAGAVGQAKNARGLTLAFQDLKTLNELRELCNSKDEFFGSFGGTLALSALNLGVQATRMGEEGRSLGVICNEIASISRQVKQYSGLLKKENTSLTRDLESLSFDICFANVAIEIIHSFKVEQSNETLSEADQIKKFGKSISDIEQLLQSCFEQSRNRALISNQSVKNLLLSYGQVSEALIKVLLTIQFSYVTGKSLAAAMRGTQNFNHLLTEILTMSDRARREIDLIASKAGDAHHKVNSWDLNSEQEIQASP